MSLGYVAAGLGVAVLAFFVVFLYALARAAKVTTEDETFLWDLENEDRPRMDDRVLQMRREAQ